MHQLSFVFCLHNHQPEGNFDSVFAQAARDAYRPFLELLRTHPGIRVAMHWSGILLDWIERHDASTFRLIGEAVDACQLELLGGGFHEPVLPAIPHVDAVGQIRKLSSWIRERFGVDVRGMWLAERVWEQHLVRIMREAGMEYTVLDDTHFQYAGLSEERLTGHLMTEEEGETLAVFPISKRLRYLIPFGTIDETRDHLRDVAARHPGSEIVYADDGEKFGVWPRTRQHVWDEGWLEQFFSMLEREAAWLHTAHFGDLLETHPPVGRMYLPNASYAEMMHWALPDPVLYRAYERIEQFLAERGEMKESRPFVRGGFWRNFMVKYPEINAMHKKMLRVSRRLHACERLLAHSVASSHAMSAHPGDARAIAMHGEREQPGAMIAGHGAGAAGRAADTALLDAQRRLADARDALWAAQCNCPYWHGVFGGLYLPHIRSQVFRNLIRAEGLLDGIDGRGAPRVESIDYDADGHPEILVETPELNAYFLPHSGGMAVALDLKHPPFNFLDTLTRREEGYHAQVRSAVVPGTMADGEARSIHDTVRAREAGLADRLVYDWHRKGGWLEHIFAPSTTLDAFARAAWTDLGDFATQPWSVSHEQDAEAISLRFERSGHIRHEGGEHALRLAKTFRFPCGSTAFTVTYEIDTEASLPQGLIFGVELNVNMLSGDAPDRYVEFGSGASRVPAGATGVAGSCTEVSVTNEWDDVRIAIGSDASFDLWHCPIETISLSEDGFERTYQGTTLVLRFPLATVAHTEYVLRHHLTSFR